jgi:hypothetical protein
MVSTTITLTQLFCLLSIPPSSKAMTVQALAASSLATLVTLEHHRKPHQTDGLHRASNRAGNQIKANHLHAELPCGDDNQCLHRGPAEVDGGEDGQEVGQRLPGACLHREMRNAITGHSSIAQQGTLGLI